MSYYYEYNFTSPERIFALVKEELKSYFDTGAIDDMLFLSYTDKCLRKLGRATYVITGTILNIEDFEARLPDNFYAVREAWMCTEVGSSAIQGASSFYSQAASSCTIQISPMIVNGNSCTSVCPPDECDPCMPNLVQAVYKTDNSTVFTYERKYLLKPGNISVKKQCDVGYMSNWSNFSQDRLNKQFVPYSSTYDSFDIRDNKFVTNFRSGVVNLIFYATEYDNVGNVLIPDNYRVMEYIEAFIKYKMFETLMNTVTDETSKQIEGKLQYYKTLSDEAFIMAEIELKKQTMWQKQLKVKKQLRRFNKYELPSHSYRSIWRRN